MQLERKREQLERQGYGIAAVTFDSPETLQHFADRVGIGYPLLADTDSAVIRRFGLLNETVPKDHAFFGMAVPGEFLVDPQGRVLAKSFEEDYRDRSTAGRTLVRVLGAGPNGRTSRIEGPRYTLSVWASDEIVRGGNVITLVLDLDLKPKMHVYAPGVEGYIPIQWSMDAPEGVEVKQAQYPESESLHLPAIGETVPVYEGKARLTRDVQLGQPEDLENSLDAEGKLRLAGALRLQVCDDKVCYLPEELDLEWTLQFEEHDRQRAPESLRAR